MQQQEIDQIKQIIQNYEAAKLYVPYLSDLEKHPAFWPLFSSLSSEEQTAVKKLIDEYIREKIEGMTKTKGGQLFKRFFESNEELFWKFRDMNEFDETTHEEQFQLLGKEVEQEMFRLEGILTERMFKQEKWLDKVVSSFYTIVYMFFPKLNAVK